MKNSRKIANLIAKRRKSRLFTESEDLISLVRSEFSQECYRMISQIFQALRMKVNNEVNLISRFIFYALVARNRRRAFICKSTC